MAKYNETVRSIYGLHQVKGEVGIEIELEGKKVLQDNVPPYWVFHVDGSLRGESAEYVLSKPIARDRVPEALDTLFKTLKAHGTRIRDDSPNTSVHVHLNVQEWTLKKVYNLITTWYIFEKMLVQWCGEEREGNLFCLRGADAEVLLQRLASAVRYSKFQYIVDADGLRYSALNPTSMGKFGSIEIRSLAGVYDQDIINKWVSILLELKDFSERYDSPPEIIQEMSRTSNDEFLRMVFPKNWRMFANAGLASSMKEGMRLVQPVAYAVNWERADAPKKKADWDEVDDIQVVPPLDRRPNRVRIEPFNPARNAMNAMPNPNERPLPGEGVAEWNDRVQRQRREREADERDAVLAAAVDLMDAQNAMMDDIRDDLQVVPAPDGQALQRFRDREAGLQVIRQRQRPDGMVEQVVRDRDGHQRIRIV